MIFSLLYILIFSILIKNELYRFIYRDRLSFWFHRCLNSELLWGNVSYSKAEYWNEISETPIYWTRSPVYFRSLSICFYTLMWHRAQYNSCQFLLRHPVALLEVCWGPLVSITTVRDAQMSLKTRHCIEAQYERYL